MLLNHLHLQGFRNLQEQKIEFRPGLNFFYGDNGAGKTSLLEAVHLLCTGKSFRNSQIRACVQSGRSAFLLHMRWILNGQEHQAGIHWEQHEWQRRLNGQDLRQHVDLARQAPCMALHPGTQQLVAAGPEGRRRLHNWLMFHVEPDFMQVWRNFQHARAQRNALLRTRQNGWALQEWTRLYLQAAGQLHDMQQACFQRWQSRLLQRLQSHPELCNVNFRFHPGWAQGESLQESLERNLERDLELGHTHAGPHRMDIRIRCEQTDARDRLSRGQQKLLAYEWVLATVSVVAEHAGHWPLLLLDDLQAELDTENLHWLLHPLQQAEIQILANGLQPADFVNHWPDSSMFHVEQGRVRPLSAC